MPIIEPRDSEDRVVRSFRLNKKLDDKLTLIAKQMGETKTYVLESLLGYAIEVFEKEKPGKKKFK